MNKRPWYKYLKDCIIYAVILFALVFVGITYFENATKADLLDLITQYVGFVATILLGFIGIIEFAYDNGLDFLVPTKFEEYKEEKLREQTKEYLKEYFEKEEVYFSLHSNDRMTHLLNQLGLSRNQFDQLKMELLSIRLMPLRNLEDAKKKLFEIVKTAKIILTQDGMDSDQLVYKQVKYFINFTDVMFDEEYYNQITDCLVLLIKEVAGAKLNGYTNVLVSHSGNFLLGMGVSQKLNKEMIKITEKPLILNNKSYIGDFDRQTPGSSILVHDVLVSGKQLRESIRKVEAHTKVEAIYCLVNRLDFGVKADLEAELGIPVYALIDLHDNDIEALLK